MIVIGAGAIGENVADRVVKGGLEAIVIEANLVGGECSYWACIPTKALLRPGAALAAATRVQGAREAATGTLDAAAVLQRRTAFTHDWDDSSQVKWVQGAGIGLVRGWGRIAGDRLVDVELPDGTREIWSARHAVVIATGSRPSVPPIPGLERVPFWGTKEATEASDIPHSLVVLGGGVSGVELAQAFSRLGSRVTIVARSGLVGGFPEPAARLLSEALLEDGIDIRLNSWVSKVGVDDRGVTQVRLGDNTWLECDQLLVSTGRKPALDELGLDQVGLEPDAVEPGPDGRVPRVEGGWLYAVGDAAGKNLLTHQGKYEARMCGDAIAARARGELGDEVRRWSPFAASANEVAVPRVAFTDPELAAVGRSVEECEKAGLKVRAVELEIDVAGASLRADGYPGWAQLVIDEDRQVIVGATFAGQDVAELLHAATIAIVGEVPLSRLWHAVPAYPTVSEVWLRLLEAYGL